MQISLFFESFSGISVASCAVNQLLTDRERLTMGINKWLLITVVLLCNCIAILGQEQSARPTPKGPSKSHVMRNGDVLVLVERGEKSGEIINKIFTSSCNFDVFPPVLEDLKRRGVPDTVLMAIQMAPNGPPLVKSGNSANISLTTPVKIPPGTVVEVETTKAFSSAHLSVGSPITFLVTKRVFVNDLLVIDRGSVARGHIVKVKRAGGWGRPGMLGWQIDDVAAVDGTKVPIKLTGTQTGASRTAAIAGGAVATGALIFPYSSPVALIWGLKKGDEAVLRGSRIFAAVAGSGSDIAGLQPRPAGVVYHDRKTVEESTAPQTSPTFDSGGFKPKISFRPKQ